MRLLFAIERSILGLYSPYGGGEYSNNSATSSAGISVQEFSTLYINSTLFQGNQADAGGAGIGISEFGQLYIADSQFEHNRGFAGNGGAIVVVDFALLQIERSTFTYDGQLVIVRSLHRCTTTCRSHPHAWHTQTHSSNAAKSGGALFTSSYEKTTIYDCDFIQNQATGGSGGALMLVNTSISMQDCTFRYAAAVLRASRIEPGAILLLSTTCWVSRGTVVIWRFEVAAASRSRIRPRRGSTRSCSPTTRPATLVAACRSSIAAVYT